MYQIHITSNLGQFTYSWASFFSIVSSLVSIYLFSLLLGVGIKRPSLRLFVACLGVFFFNVLLAYHFASTQQFEWAFFADNTDLILSWDSLYAIYHSLELSNLAYAPVVIAFICYVDYKWKSIRFPKWKLSLGAQFIALGLYIGVIFLPVATYDPFVSLVRSLIFYYNSPIKYVDSNYSRFTQTLVPNDMPRLDRPHVFMIVVESLNADFLEYKDSNGDLVTPFLSELINQSIYIENFYGNSVQTAKGDSAILLSAMPSFRGKIFRKFQRVQFDSIFNMLKKEQYYSVFFKGNHQLDYDNTKSFLFTHGVDEVLSVHDFMKTQDALTSSTWGVREDIVMNSFFDYFDRYRDRSSDPIMATIVTTQSHFPFILPKQSRLIWKDANTIKQHYANCLKHIDNGIKVFYEELESRSLSNAIVIITADHAFPLGDHGLKSLEAGYYEDSYRIPFILTAPNLKPRRLDGPYSQVDIAPTILDLLNIKAENTYFTGNSIFGSFRNMVLQIQPYAKQIGIIDYPFKYRYAAKTDTEYLFNIALDPLEKNNIISEISTDSLQLYRSKVSDVYSVQQYYELNQ